MLAEIQSPCMLHDYYYVMTRKRTLGLWIGYRAPIACIVLQKQSPSNDYEGLCILVRVMYVLCYVLRLMYVLKGN